VRVLAFWSQQTTSAAGTHWHRLTWLYCACLSAILCRLFLCRTTALAGSFWCPNGGLAVLQQHNGMAYMFASCMVSVVVTFGDGDARYAHLMRILL
jgi:hypothetical protein